jgi:hydrogenase assembly chaperone HypC/HupF
MCLSAAGRVISVQADEDAARVDIGGRVRRASTWLVPDAAPGDWVEVGAGALLRRLSEAEAAELAALNALVTEGDVP